MVREQISSQSKIGKTIIHVYNETIWYVGSDKNDLELFNTISDIYFGLLQLYCIMNLYHY